MTVRRAWLDTFDWRLYRAGLTLEQVTARGTAELVLTGRDGALIAGRGRRAGTAVPRLPVARPPGVVPLGPLREHLEPVVGVRALCRWPGRPAGCASIAR